MSFCAAPGCNGPTWAKTCPPGHAAAAAAPHIPQA